MLTRRAYFSWCVAGLALGLVLFFVVAPAASAQTDFSMGIVPRCNVDWNEQTARFNNPCTLCHLFELAGNVINFFVRLIMFPAASILIIVGGGFMLTSASSQRYKTGKEIITKTVIGIVIVLVSYVAVMTILWVLLPDPTGENTRRSFRIGVNGFQIQCTPSPRPQPSDGGGGGQQSSGGGESTVPGGGGAGGALPTAGGGLACPNPGTLGARLQTFCSRVQERMQQARTTDARILVPTVDSCRNAIQNAATRYSLDQKLFLSILENESSGNPFAENNSGPERGRSCGLAQVNVNTAINDPRFRTVISGDTCTWLKTHPLENVEMGAAVLAQAKSDAESKKRQYGYPERDRDIGLSLLDLTIAGYNGGTRANDPSVNCAPSGAEVCPEQSRATQIPRWACSVDRQGGTCIPNQGYEETRRYVANVRRGCFES